MSKQPVELLSIQIAETMLASCSAETPSLDDLLSRETLTKIIEQIRTNKGRVRLGLASKIALKLAPNDTIIKKFNFLKSKIDPANLHAMSVSASKRDDASLSKTIRAIIDELDYTDDINSIFEANPTSGGRGRTRKQCTRTQRRRRRNHRHYSRRN
jgi:hypothetical protein